ncbi:MAG: STAS domain-containing protein [Opitutales bacterium]|jgi:anti-anti-sigma regulatory factor
MATDSQPVYLVQASSDPVVLAINGRASYLNCAPVHQFFERMLKLGRRRFILDFSRCTGMDSTFLGIIAGTAVEVRKAEPPGGMTLLGLSPRNLELVRNLGLARLVTVDSGEYPMNFSADKAQTLSAPAQQELANAKLILKAHENLVAADPGNREKFQDVLAFLKGQMLKEAAEGK